MNMNLLAHIWNSKEINSLLDIGANVGMYSEFFSRVRPSADILMIEGNPDCEEQLKLRRKPYRIACLSDSVKEVKLYKNPNNPVCTGTSYYLEQTEHYDENNFISVQTQRLDDMVDREYDFIKIDVQGAEKDVINGGIITFLRAKYIQVEMSLIEYNKGSPFINDMMPFLYERGFRLAAHIEDHFKDDKLIQMDFVFANLARVE